MAVGSAATGAARRRVRRRERRRVDMGRELRSQG
jgi:hypothetical protein